MQLSLQSSPHIREKHSTRTIMLDVIIALLPALLVGSIVLGIRSLLVVSLIREVLGEQSITLSNPFDSTQSVTLPLLTEFKISFFTSAAGAFVTMGILLAVIAAFKQAKENKAKKGDAK